MRYHTSVDGQRVGHGWNKVNISMTMSQSSAGSELAFVACAAAFLIAAAVIATLLGFTSAVIVHGWWLVAYLGLVGGVAQLMLGPGLFALGKHSGNATIEMRHKLPALVLWNVGTIIVAAADLASSPIAVLGGSVLLVASLGLFSVGLRDVRLATRRSMSGWEWLYAFLLLFLGVSVVIGTVLGYRGRG